MKLSIILCTAILLASCTGHGTDEGQKNLPVIEPWIGSGKTSILVDSIHQWEARPDFVFDENEFRYCHSQTVSRLMKNLIAHDFRYRQIREGMLDDQVLKGHDVVFINVPTFRKGGRSVPDREFPRLRPEETEALVRYVENGGGLFVIAEHNNAYDNASVLNPLLNQFGIEVPAAYAIDHGRKARIGGSTVLISIWNYREHPVTRKLRATSWLGGAPFKTDHGIAFLSDEGHIDFGNYITHKPSKHSNKRMDPGEYKGPGVPVFAAVEKGKGRVVVIGDHNMIGIQWLGTADNYRFAMNAFAWLAKRENEKPHIADLPPQEFVLGMDLTHSEWNTGIRSRRGFHAGFINFARHPDIFPMGLLDLDDHADMLVFLDPPDSFPEEDLKKISKRLQKGQRVLLLMDPSDPKQGSLDILSHLVPDIEFVLPASSLGLDMLEAGKRQQLPRRFDVTPPVYSEELGLDGLELGILMPGREGLRKLSGAKPYLLDLTLNKGKPMVWAVVGDKRKIAVMNRIPVGGGELILMPQGKMWGNDTFGKMRDEPFNHAARGAHELQMAFLRWIAKRPPILKPEPE